MKTAILAVMMLTCCSAFAGDHYVRGYTTKAGTWVEPHRQTDPNATKADNWSTRGNVNPYTGRAGTKRNAN